MKLDPALDAIITITGPNVGVQRITTALTNRVYKISNAKQQWCLRINQPNEKKLGLDRASEAKLLHLISDKPWAPQVEYHSPKLLLTRWLDAKAVKIEADSELLLNLMKQVQAIKFNPEFGIRTLDISQQIQLYLAQLTTAADGFKLFVERLCEDYQLPPTLKLCHHDWHAGNLITTPEQSVLLDWEYAAWGDPLIDLACLHSGFQMSDRQALDFADLLAINISDQSWLRAKCLVELMALTWFCVRRPEKDWQPQQLAWLTKWRNQI